MLNAHLRRRLPAYLAGLGTLLAEGGETESSGVASFNVVRSNDGFSAARQAPKLPAHLGESGVAEVLFLPLVEFERRRDYRAGWRSRTLRERAFIPHLRVGNGTQTGATARQARDAIFRGTTSSKGGNQRYARFQKLVKIRVHSIILCMRVSLKSSTSWGVLETASRGALPMIANVLVGEVAAVRDSHQTSMGRGLSQKMLQPACVRWGRTGPQGYVVTRGAEEKGAKVHDWHVEMW